MDPVAEPSRDRMIVYVDGFNLYHGMHDKFGHSTLWLDLVQLAGSFRPRQDLVRVKYFTAAVLNEPEAQSRQAHYVAALEHKYPHTFRPVWGRYQKKRPLICTCGKKHPRYEEKETDVNIATSILTDAALQNMDTAIVVSADSDMVPAVVAAQKINPQLFVTAAFPPKRQSNHLRKLLPASFPIDPGKLTSMQLPDEFRVGARTFKRPDKWR
ncbi:NYN domain-containing protein [Microbacterium sp. YY-01]|uniref:NYN domain-containing protein n=1 Tax=Microbacterium sp. YY-01 TaxID=3421634 RepID=UPI003D17511C